MEAVRGWVWIFSGIVHYQDISFGMKFLWSEITKVKTEQS